MEKKRRVFMYISFLLAGIISIVILVLASFNGEKSSSQSNGLTEIVNDVFSLFNDKKINEVKLEKIDIGDDLVLDYHTTYQLNPSISPDNALDKDVFYTSNDEKIATVNEKGLISTVGIGETTIKAYSSRYHDIYDEIKVTVNKVPLQDLKINLYDVVLEDNMTLSLNKTYRIDYLLEPINAYVDSLVLSSPSEDMQIEYKYNNENEVVSSYFITPKKEGNYLLEAYVDKNLFKQFNVNVIYDENVKISSTFEIEADVKEDKLIPNDTFNIKVLLDSNTSETSLLIRSRSVDIKKISDEVSSKRIITFEIKTLKPAEFFVEFKYIPTGDIKMYENKCYAVLASSIYFNLDSIIRVGDIIDLKAIYSPTNTTYLDAVFSSSNEAICSVTKEGKLIAKEIGTATITLKSEINNVEKSISITIKRASFFSKEGLKQLEKFLRKAIGHFSMFLLLGLFTYLGFLQLNILKNRYNLKYNVIYASISLGYGFFIAALSEALQSLTANRGPSFKDVMLDTGGVISGIAILILICFISFKIKKEKNIK